jgi:hypothetical protein
MKKLRLFLQTEKTNIYYKYISSMEDLGTSIDEEENNLSNINPIFLTAYLGNWKNHHVNDLRLLPRYTCNKGFFSCLTYILECLPYIEANYSDKIIMEIIQILRFLAMQLK